MSRYARWHADGLILEAEDLPSLVLSRRGTEVNYDVSVGSHCKRSADSAAPTTKCEGIFGVYDMVSGPFVALVLESEPAFDDEFYEVSESDPLSSTRSLRRVVKIGLAPLFRDGRRLNSRVKADEVLQTRLLTEALAEFPFVFSFDAPATATRASSLTSVNGPNVLQENSGSESSSYSSSEIDEDDAGTHDFYLLDEWDRRFLWNRRPLEKIFQSIANEGDSRAYAWCLRCCAASCASAAVDNVRAMVLTRLSCQSLGRAGSVALDHHLKNSIIEKKKKTKTQDFLGRNFAETEVILTNEDGAASGAVFARSEKPQSDGVQGTVDSLLAAYGGDFVTFVDVTHRGDATWKTACAEVASLKNGAKLRHVVIDASSDDTTAPCLVGAMSLARPRPLNQSGLTRSRPTSTKSEGDYLRAKKKNPLLKKTHSFSPPFAPGLALFCGADEDVDVAMLKAAASCLLPELSSTASKSAAKAALDSAFFKESASRLRSKVADPQLTSKTFVSRMRTLLFAALFDGQRDDGLDLLLAAKADDVDSRPLPRESSPTKAPPLKTKRSKAKLNLNALRFIPAETNVYPLDLVDDLAIKVLLLLLVILLALYETTNNQSLPALLSCALCILGQTLLVVFAKSLRNGSLVHDLAHRRRIVQTNL